MVFLIKVKQTKTKEVSLPPNDFILKLNNVQSKIEGLVFRSDNARGSTNTIPITDTLKPFEIKISGGDVWFEYTSTDKEYELELFI